MIQVNKDLYKNILNKRVTVIGLGLSGKQFQFLLANHLGAIVYASDSGSSEEVIANASELMHHYHIASETGVHTNKIYDSDLWIISPGISAASKIVNEAYNQNIPIVRRLNLQAGLQNLLLSGITGSNGKTTTTHILNQMFIKEICWGYWSNIGVPFLKVFLKNY